MGTPPSRGALNQSPKRCHHRNAAIAEILASPKCRHHRGRAALQGRVNAPHAVGFSPGGSPHHLERNRRSHNRRRLRPQNRISGRSRNPSRFLKPSQLLIRPPTLGSNCERNVARRGFKNIPQPHALGRPRKRLRQHNARPTRHRTAKLLELHRLTNLGRPSPPRLFTRLKRNTQPSLMTLDRCGRQVRIRSPRDYRNNPPHANLSALLNRPLHAIKLEDGQRQRNSRKRFHFEYTAQRKLNPPVRNRTDRPPPDFTARSNIKLLPDLGPKHAHQMTRILIFKNAGTTENLVSNPPSACHGIVPSSQLSALSSQLSALSSQLSARANQQPQIGTSVKFEE